jgi:proteasome lid subunit RPN8/RPN11
MTRYSSVSANEGLLQAIFAGAKRLYPRETIILLRGKKSKSVITLSELVVPPLAKYGKGFAHIPLHMLPMDFSLVGTAHSHPSGNLTPSNEDLNHFLGVILMIVGFPFSSEKDIAVYSRDGNKLDVKVTKVL